MALLIDAGANVDMQEEVSVSSSMYTHWLIILATTATTASTCVDMFAHCGVNELFVAIIFCRMRKIISYCQCVCVSDTVVKWFKQS